MKADEFLKSIENKPLEEANEIIFSSCGVKDYLPPHEEAVNVTSDEYSPGQKEEFGDWQTNMVLARSICRHIQESGLSPDVIIEPTCGKGAFILAAIDTFPNVKTIYGVEIYKPYLDSLKKSLLEKGLDRKAKHPTIVLKNGSVFDYDFPRIAKTHKEECILVIGNPPWVTNSKLSSLNSCNLPQKTNFKQTKGLDAVTGKGNFDIAEYISMMLLRSFSKNNGKFAFLVKNIVPKNIVHEQPKSRLPISNICQWNIDATKEFGVSASASLFICDFGEPYSSKCSVFDFYTKKHLYDYGWERMSFVSNIREYRQTQNYDGVCPFEWWSGVKHDCSKIMELRKNDAGDYYNALGEKVDIESDLIFPLVKSSDIGDEQIVSTSRYIIITQHYASENTDYIRQMYPKAYDYLDTHSEALDGRKSIIYKKRPRFSIFGIGSYSFAPYKIAVSGLYKHTRFSLIPPIEGKPVILDDTCYLIGFESETTAKITLEILNSQRAQALLHALMFSDSKRVINKDLLMRVDLKALADAYSAEELETTSQKLNEYKSLIVSQTLF